MENEDKGKPEFRRTSSQLVRVGKGTSRKLVQMGRFFKTGLVFSLLSVYMAVEAVGANLQQPPPQDTTFFRIQVDTVTEYVDIIPDSVFVTPCDTPPEYIGGNEALFKFIEDNLMYPQGWESHIEGKVIVSFDVERDGSLTNFEIVRSLHPDFDEEAIRVLKLMPEWKPAKLRGETVRVKYTLPVKFQLKK